MHVANVNFSLLNRESSITGLCGKIFNGKIFDYFLMTCCQRGLVTCLLICDINLLPWCRVCSEVVKARLFYEMTVFGVFHIGAKATSIYIVLHLDINLLPCRRVCSEMAKVLKIL